MTNPETTTQPAPVYPEEISLEADVPVTILFMGGARPLALLLPPHEVDELRELAETPPAIRMSSITLHDANGTAWNLTPDMVAAVGAPGPRATWQLLSDANKQGVMECLDPDLVPKTTSVAPTRTDGFRSQMVCAGNADRPPAWMRTAVVELASNGIHTKLARAL